MWFIVAFLLDEEEMDFLEDFEDDEDDEDMPRR